MIVGVCRLLLHLPGKTSLKAKRQVVKSILQRLTNEFGIAAAEVEEQDRWQIAVIGLACVSNATAHANEILSNAMNYVQRTRPDVELIDYELEFLDVF